MFITLEGPEGSGKTTAVKAAVAKLKELGYEVVQTREPGGTPIAEQIRNVILDKANTTMDPKPRLCFMLQVDANISLKKFGQQLKKAK